MNTQTLPKIFIENEVASMAVVAGFAETTVQTISINNPVAGLKGCQFRITRKDGEVDGIEAEFFADGSSVMLQVFADERPSRTMTFSNNHASVSAGDVQRNMEAVVEAIATYADDYLPLSVFPSFQFDQDELNALELALPQVADLDEVALSVLFDCLAQAADKPAAQAEMLAALKAETDQAEDLEALFDRMPAGTPVVAANYEGKPALGFIRDPEGRRKERTIEIWHNLNLPFSNRVSINEKSRRQFALINPKNSHLIPQEAMSKHEVMAAMLTARKLGA